MYVSMYVCICTLLHTFFCEKSLQSLIWFNLYFLVKALITFKLQCYNFSILFKVIFLPKIYV